MNIPNVLSIAGSDPSGGAGLQADLKTFGALGAYGMAAVTALTAQNTQGVRGWEEVSPVFVADQLCAVFDDVRVDAVKIGMLGSAGVVEAVAEVLARYKPPCVVLDPVMVATSGDSLVAADAVAAMKDCLIPLCDVLTPNIPEGEKLLRKSVMDMEDAARDLLALGADCVYLKGGHLKGAVARDVLAFRGGHVEVFEAARLDVGALHGTGCTLSSALAVFLAKGMPVAEAARLAKDFVYGAIVAASHVDVGGGVRPLHHFYRVEGRG